MRAVDKADAHESSFRAEDVGVNFVERIAAVVIIAIAGRTANRLSETRFFAKAASTFSVFRSQISSIREK